MKTLADHLGQYAAYHREARNIATHFIGIPLIVVAVAMLLSRPSFEAGGVALSPATLAVLAAAVFYLRLDLRLGLLMAALLALAHACGAWAAAQSTATWLWWGVGTFILGWAIQFLGHAWEGRKPAFVDDVMGLAVGPLFVVVEALFGLGLLKGLKAEVERRAGPVRHGRATA